MKTITEKHKRYFLLIMLFVAGLVGYFRFVHSPGVNKNPIPPNETKHENAQLPPAKQAPKLTTHLGLNAERPTRQQIARNIFQPTGPLPVLAQIQQAPGVDTAKAEMTLSGTLIGKESSMAIINNQFMTQNQMVGRYRITRITPDRVYLVCGKEEICLKVLSLAQAITPTPPQHGNK